MTIDQEKLMSTDLLKYLETLLINVLLKEYPLLEIMEVYLTTAHLEEFKCQELSTLKDRLDSNYS